MANAAKLLHKPLRILLVGYPGSAKTGSLAPLANAGFKLRILDYDGNLDPLLRRLTPEGQANVDSLYFEDDMKMGGKFLDTKDPIPSAFAKGFEAMDNWVSDGTSLGASKDWGLDTIVVLDSLTKMGEAAMNRSRRMLNKTVADTTDRVWGMAMAEQSHFIDRLTSEHNTHHVIVLAHLKMISPKDIRKGDSTIAQEVKKQVSEIMDTRLYPRALGWELPQVIAADFPIVIEAKAETKHTGTNYKLNIRPRPELDLKFPGVENIGPTLDINDGLLKVFQALSPASFELLTKLKGETA